MKIKRRKKLTINGLSKGGKISVYIGMILMSIIALFPLVWVVISSFKGDPLAEPGFALPSKLVFDGYISVFKDMNILRYFGNSIIVSLTSVVLSITMISLSAYVVARTEFKGKGIVTALLLSTMFIPATAMTFPVYNLVNNMGIHNKHSGLIFIYTCSGIAVSFFIIKNYFATIPKEIEEAAFIDGCNFFQTFTMIIFPIARPGIMTAAVLAFMNNWNEYYWSSMVLIDKEKLTVPALLSQFTTSFSTNYNGLFSAIVVIVIPPIILFCCCSKYFVEALSGGAVKG
ncbi:carbohydrate ABC transporter permease [Clostridium sp. NSJ-6]|uniref:Carbohydrate ABC transporter permease n=1 Tax=Clostridium hominis TaxID=2763036 RepID=A0ABR7D9Y1_9CLOT|nr:carbohydrate ABC transporter permease [Clostridium hominis]MBC5628189.1 carbohydrate ABC transporter permease [Clostridium hominis]MDU2671363.1 carbohydrate ABC transporter permease [Clostridium sp.]